MTTLPLGILLKTTSPRLFSPLRSRGFSVVLGNSFGGWSIGPEDGHLPEWAQKIQYTVGYGYEGVEGQEPQTCFAGIGKETLTVAAEQHIILELDHNCNISIIRSLKFKGWFSKAIRSAGRNCKKGI